MELKGFEEHPFDPFPNSSTPSASMSGEIAILSQRLDQLQQLQKRQDTLERIALAQEKLLDHFLQQAKPPAHAQVNAVNPPTSVTDWLIEVGIVRANYPVKKAILAGLMSGLFVVFGGMVATVCSGGMTAEYRVANPWMPKLFVGLTFPVALMLILAFGSELFTGNTMYLMLGWWHGKVTLRQLAQNWTLSFFSNLAGTMFFSYFLGYYTDIFAKEPWRSYIVGIAEAKVTMSWGVCFFRAVGANALVCLAVFTAYSSRESIGRILGMFLPIFTFATIGFEHVVANMFYLPIGIWYGARVSAASAIVHNIIPACLGNIVGGALIIALSASYLYGPGAWFMTSCSSSSSSSSFAAAAAATMDMTSDKHQTSPPTALTINHTSAPTTTMPLTMETKDASLVARPLPSHTRASSTFTSTTTTTTTTAIAAASSTPAGGVLVSASPFLPLDSDMCYSDGDGELMVYHKRYRTKSGHMVSVRVEASLMLENGQPTHIMAFVYPTSSTPHVDQQQSQQQQRVAESDPIVHASVKPPASSQRGTVFVRCVDHRILTVDDSFCAIVGYSRRELLEMNVEALTVEEDRAVTSSQVVSKLNKLIRRKGSDMTTTTSIASMSSSSSS